MTGHELPHRDRMAVDYDRLLDRAGATGLDAADRAALRPGLEMMDAKIALIRRNAAERGTGFSLSPVSE